MAEKYTFPEGNALAKLLKDLLEKDVQVLQTRGPLLSMEPTDKRAYGAYASPSKRLAGLAVCDVAFGASTGGALSMMVPGVIKAVIQRGVLDETLRENAAEIFNIMSYVFMTSFQERAVLTETCFEWAEMKDELRTFVTRSKAAVERSICYDVTIDGLPKGTLRIILAEND